MRKPGCGKKTNATRPTPALSDRHDGRQCDPLLQYPAGAICSGKFGGSPRLACKLISFRPDFGSLTLQLREFLYHNLYFHPDIAVLNTGPLEKMQFLFEIFLNDPDQLGKKA